MSNPVNIKFSDASLALIQNIMSRYPEGKQKSALIPVLHIAQADFDGWLSPQTMDLVASVLKIQSVEVYEVASFYSMFHLAPVGNCVFDVCRTSSCWSRGADNIIAHIGKRLGIKPGETTSDGMFTLKAVECSGSCGTAPMLQCGASFHENLTPEKVDALIDSYRAAGTRRSYTDMDYKNTL